MSARFEIRIPIAPTPGFYSNVRLAVLSLARLGEPYASAPVLVSVGYGADMDAVRAANAWSRDHPVRWFGVPPAIWADGGYERGAPAERFPATLEPEIVIHCDADVCVTGRFDGLLEALTGPAPRIAGLMAHQSPFAPDPVENDAAWRRLLDACGLPGRALEHRYSMASPDVCGRCPAYFNGGFVAVNRAAWQVLGAPTDRFTRIVRPLLREGYYAAQIGLAMAVAGSRVEVVALPLAYNCPNTDAVFDHGLSSVEEIRVLHYQRADAFDRHAFLSDRAAFERFRTAAFAGRVNRYAQRHVLSFEQPFFEPGDAAP